MAGKSGVLTVGRVMPWKIIKTQFFGRGRGFVFVESKKRYQPFVSGKTDLLDSTRLWTPVMEVAACLYTKK